jgi:hypothetical protein
VAWIGFYVGIGVVGVAALAAVGIRLYRQVRELGRDVKEAAARIAAASEQLSRETASRTTRA